MAREKLSESPSFSRSKISRVTRTLECHGLDVFFSFTSGFLQMIARHMQKKGKVSLQHIFRSIWKQKTNPQNIPKIHGNNKLLVHSFQSVYLLLLSGSATLGGCDLPGVFGVLLVSLLSKTCFGTREGLILLENFVGRFDVVTWWYGCS